MNESPARRGVFVLALFGFSAAEQLLRVKAEAERRALFLSDPIKFSKGAMP
ncbi:MAG TPA: hypothetical protein VLB89_04680 [Gaiellaceae bacterium]|nr:hypothetical protein [Gaiellaceae bacterium]